MFTIGIDFGTNSCRAIVVSCADGSTIGTGVSEYHSGDQGVLTHPSDPHLARQNPADYIGSLGHAISAALAQAASSPGFSRDRVIGIGVDTTGSTPLPIDRKARPLALDPQWEGHLAAQAWLWKDHTGSEEAAAITAIAKQHAPQYLEPIGGTYSSEWWWSKIWKCLKVAPDVFDAAASWVELADFVPAVLAGVSDSRDIVRCVCAAGHKAMYSEAWGGLPSKEFLARLDPKLAELRDRLYEKALPPGIPAGNLCREWANALGLREGIVIAMGGFDAHYGAVGSGIEVGTLVKIIGTSTCDCAIAPIDEPSPKRKEGSSLQVPGICGIVNGSILPGFLGIEAGQSAVGDILKWWVEGVCACRRRESAEVMRSSTCGAVPRSRIDQARCVWAAGARLEQRQPHDPRRSEIDRPPPRPDTAHDARGDLSRVDRSHRLRRAHDHRAHARLRRADRARGVLRRHRGEERRVHADLRRRDRPADADCRLVAGAGAWRRDRRGGHRGRASIVEGGAAGDDVGQGRRFEPDPEAHAVYNELHAIYRELHDEFGGVRNADLGSVMKQLLAIRARVNV